MIANEGFALEYLADNEKENLEMEKNHFQTGITPA